MLPLCSGINILGNQQQLTSEKVKPLDTILCIVPAEIPICSKMSNVVTLLSAKRSTWSESTTSGVLDIVVLKQFSPFVNIFCLKHASLYTSYITLSISQGLYFSATKSLKHSNLPSFWIASRQIFFEIRINSKQYKVYIYGKKF